VGEQDKREKIKEYVTDKNNKTVVFIATGGKFQFNGVFNGFSVSIENTVKLKQLSLVRRRFKFSTRQKEELTLP
jgi:hypothetical protein